MLIFENIVLQRMISHLPSLDEKIQLAQSKPESLSAHTAEKGIEK